ncbi:MAG TPA: hypothetical protein VMW57_10625 [Methyloceanibacter sp.]|nr:hypothetical protein [Methyloceanibacter sp.]
MHNTLPVTELISARLHTGAAASSACAAPAPNARPNRTAIIIRVWNSLLSLPRPRSATILTTWDAVWSMASIKQHHNNPSLLNVLRGLVGIAPSARSHPNKPKAAQPGARFARPDRAGKNGTGKEIFGQRKNCSSYTNR